MQTLIKPLLLLLASDLMAGLQGRYIASAELCGGGEVGAQPRGEAPSGQLPRS